MSLALITCILLVYCIQQINVFHFVGHKVNKFSFLAPPTNLQVLIINISSLRLLWDYPTTDQSTQFLVQALSQDFNNSYQNISGLLNSTHFTYNGTRIGSYYIFQVIAYQGGVASSPSHPTRIFENGSTGTLCCASA